MFYVEVSKCSAKKYSKTFFWHKSNVKVTPPTQKKNEKNVLFCFSESVKFLFLLILASLAKLSELGIDILDECTF